MSILSFYFIMNTPVNAQITFQRTFGGANVDYAYSVQQTGDDGFVIAGYTTSFGAGSRDVYLIRTDFKGKLLWSKTFGENNSDYAWAVEQTTDGGYILGGHSGSFGIGSHDVYLIKCAQNGKINWTKAIGGSSADGAYSIQQTVDGGYIIAAHTSSFGAGQHDIYLIKTDAEGETLWTKTYGGSNGDFLRSVHQTTDEGYILVAETFSFGAGTADVYLVRTNSSGELLWTKTYGGSSPDYGYSVKQTTDGGYIIAGYTSSFGQGQTDLYLLKTDDTGDVLWSKTYGGNASDYGYSVQQTTDRGYIVAGYTESFGIAGDVYLIRTDSDGELLWSKAFGSAGNDGGWSVQQTADGGYIVAGYSGSFGAGNKDVYLIKTDELGNSGCNDFTTGTISNNAATIVNSTQTLIGSGALMNNAATKTGDTPAVDSLLCSNFPTGINQLPGHRDANAVQFAMFQNYPNPFNPSTTIRFTVPSNTQVTLKIFDVRGREIETLAKGELDAGEHTVEWNANGLASGIYFYRLIAGDFVSVRKLILMQ